MSLKTDIKKAITNNTKYFAKVMYKPDIRIYGDDSIFMIIEVGVRKKKKPKKT